MRKIKKSGFSLMEMMIVLLIVAIVAAATAPIVTKKMAKSGGGAANGPWSYIGLSNSITYNQNGKDVTAAIGTKNVPGIHPRLFINGAVPLALGNANTVRGTFRIDNNNNLSLETGQNFIYNPNGGNMSAIIGSNSRPNNINPKLYIKSSGSEPQIALGDSAGNIVSIIADIVNGKFGMSNSTLPNNTVALGSGHSFSNTVTNNVVMGNNITVSSKSSYQTKNAIAIGNGIKVNTCGIGIGFNIANNNSTDSRSGIMIGTDIEPSGGIVIGTKGWDKAPKAEVNAIAIGSSAVATSPSSAFSGVAIGTMAGTAGGIAIGYKADSSSSTATAIGREAGAKKTNSTAIGPKATAKHEKTVVISTGSQATESVSNNQIVLGSPLDTVYIPGNIVVGKNLYVGNRSYLGFKGLNSNNLWASYKSPGSTHSKSAYFNYDRSIGFGTCPTYDGTESIGGNDYTSDIYIGDFDTLQEIYGNTFTNHSDRRLKNVGEKFTSGLEQIKKLDLYNFTFKKDEAKTPQVGVMAQDLQKIFPNAVWKGEDGYLRIRWDEMFYAVINAVKELDAKVTTAFEQIKANTDKVAKLQAQVNEQQKVIADLEKRLAKLEKKEK